MIGLDPGETTGYAIMDGDNLIECGQINTKKFNKESIGALHALLSEADRVAVEDYRVYGWEAEKHKWAALHTPKLIGAIEAYCIMSSISCKLRMAVTAKKFVTDDKLKAWGLYKKGQRHARDAIRHAVYDQIFGDKS